MKIHVGLREMVKVIGENVVETLAKFDTGAARSCIDMRIAAKARIGPIVKTVKVVSATRKKYRRAIVMATIEVCGKCITLPIGIDDRKNLKEKVLIGRDIIGSNFIIDIGKEK